MTLTRTIATNVKAKYSIVMELEAISILLSILSKCFFNSPAAESQTPAEHLREHWIEADKTFDVETINRVYPSTCKAIKINHRRNGGKRLRDYTRIEITEASNAALQEAMEQPAHVAMAVCDEAPDYEDDDDGTPN